MAALIVSQEVANDRPFCVERVNMVALTKTLTTKNQKTSRGPSTSDGSRRRRRRSIKLERYESSIVLKQKFAGRLRHFYQHGRVSQQTKIY